MTSLLQLCYCHSLSGQDEGSKQNALCAHPENGQVEASPLYQWTYSDTYLQKWFPNLYLCKVNILLADVAYHSSSCTVLQICFNTKSFTWPVWVRTSDWELNVSFYDCFCLKSSKFNSCKNRFIGFVPISKSRFRVLLRAGSCRWVITARQYMFKVQRSWCDAGLYCYLSIIALAKIPDKPGQAVTPGGSPQLISEALLVYTFIH